MDQNKQAALRAWTELTKDKGYFDLAIARRVAEIEAIDLTLSNGSPTFLEELDLQTRRAWLMEGLTYVRVIAKHAGIPERETGIPTTP